MGKILAVRARRPFPPPSPPGLREGLEATSLECPRSLNLVPRERGRTPEFLRLLLVYIEFQLNSKYDDIWQGDIASLDNLNLKLDPLICT